MDLYRWGWPQPVSVRWMLILVVTLVAVAAGSGALRDQHFDYDEDLARLSVVYSSAAYDRNPTVANWSFANPECNERTPGFIINETYVGDVTDAFAYVGLDPASKRVVAAFKGTSNLHDWMTDLRTWLRYNSRCAPSPPGMQAPTTFSTNPGVPTTTSPSVPLVVSKNSMDHQQQQRLRRRLLRQEGQEQREERQDELIGNVHFGFCEYYQSIAAEGLGERVALLAEENPDYTVFVTGHSLGAAAAAVCAADLTQRMLVASSRVVLYTLGEPRTGDGVFAEGLNDRVGTAYRVVHDKDIVPHLSLCCHGWFGKCEAGRVSCPYQHSTEVVYANDMSPGSAWLICNDTIGEDYACDPQAIDLSVSDHTHYFELPVGEYCATAPDEMAAPFRLANAREETRREEGHDTSLRRGDNLSRVGGTASSEEEEEEGERNTPSPFHARSSKALAGTRARSYWFGRRLRRLNWCGRGLRKWWRL